MDDADEESHMSKLEKGESADSNSTVSIDEDELAKK